MARLMRLSVRVLQSALLGCVLLSLFGLFVLRLLSPRAQLRAVAAAAPPRALAAAQHWPPPLSLPAWRSTPSHNACSHTVGERAFSADSRGRVCRRRDLGSDGCCTHELPGPPCARDRCHRRWRCCRGHAFCTQCCMSAGDDFFTCSNRCRISSASVISGNRYRYASLCWCDLFVNVIMFADRAPRTVSVRRRRSTQTTCRWRSLRKTNERTNSLSTNECLCVQCGFELRAGVSGAGPGVLRALPGAHQQLRVDGPPPPAVSGAM